MDPAREPLITGGNRGIGLCLLLVLLAGAGCELAWNVANRGQLEDDIESLLARSGVSNTAAKHCSMIGTTRAGRCEYELEAEQVDQLVGLLGLSTVDLDAPGDAILPRLPEERDSCVSLAPDEQALRIWTSTESSASLRLDNGGAFAYLFIVVATDSHVCVQVEYAYG